MYDDRVGKRSDFVEYVLELMAPAGPVQAKAMFGGHGLYRDETMFAIIVDDTLYLKADDRTRGEFQALGLDPFTYELPNRKIVSMSYFRAPDRAMDDPAYMKPWVDKAHEAARRAHARKADHKKPTRQKARHSRNVKR
jgi:DNA transformation protein